jgi:hypothetical protein
VGRRDYCNDCGMKPCMGGRGPGSCVGGKKGAGQRRSERVGLPENTVKHMHDYRWVRDYDEQVRDGKKTYKYFYQEFKCIATRGKCGRPKHVDYIRRVRVD